MQRSLFSRNLYKCTKCERATHQCRLEERWRLCCFLVLKPFLLFRLWHTAKCRGFSRVHPGWGDERCFKCSKKIDSTAKEDKKKEKAEDIGETKTLLLRRRCSWCLDETEFSLDQVYLALDFLVVNWPRSKAVFSSCTFTSPPTTTAA